MALLNINGKISSLDYKPDKSRIFSASNVTVVLAGMIMNGALLLLPLYYQQVRGESVLFTGILMIPRGIGMLLTRSWVGGLADRMGSRSVGFAAAAFIPSLLLSVHPKETPVKQA